MGIKNAAEKSKLAVLEAVRGFAALYVFIHHAHIAPNNYLGMLLYFGQEVVILFFLLSGFVIDYSLKNGSFEAKKYFKLRFRRIYPIFLMALILSYIAACLIHKGWASVYPSQLVGNILMLQDVSALKRGVWFDTYQSNSPLWSLSYEWCFYLLFIPIMLLPARGKLHLFVVFLISFFGWLLYQLVPNPVALFFSYFIIWWAGVELSREFKLSGNLTFLNQRILLGALLILVMLQLIPIFMFHRAGIHLQLGIDPVLQFRHYAVTVLFVIIAIFWQSKKIKIPKWFMGFSYIAPISYGIYIMHVPILNVIHKFVLERSIIIFLIAIPIVFLFGWLLESVYQKSINKHWRI